MVPVACIRLRITVRVGLRSVDPCRRLACDADVDSSRAYKGRRRASALALSHNDARRKSEVWKWRDKTERSRESEKEKGGEQLLVSLHEPLGGIE